MTEARKLVSLSHSSANCRLSDLMLDTSTKEIASADCARTVPCVSTPFSLIA